MLRYSSSAISWLESPWTTRPRTVDSRGLRPSASPAYPPPSHSWATLLSTRVPEIASWMIVARSSTVMPRSMPHSTPRSRRLGAEVGAQGAVDGDHDRGRDLDPVVEVGAVLLVQLDDVVEHDVGLRVHGPARGDGERSRGDVEGVPEAERRRSAGSSGPRPTRLRPLPRARLSRCRGPRRFTPTAGLAAVRRGRSCFMVPWVHGSSASAWPRCRTAPGWRTRRPAPGRSCWWRRAGSAISSWAGPSRPSGCSTRRCRRAAPWCATTGRGAASRIPTRDHGPWRSSWPRSAP